jgi:hypothetical protein
MWETILNEKICYFEDFNPAVILSKDIQIDDKIWIKLNLKKCISIFVKEIFFLENRQDNSDLKIGMVWFL